MLTTFGASDGNEVILVVVGGVLATGPTVLLELARRRREVKVAGRLLAIELDDAARILAVSVKDLRNDKPWPYERKEWSRTWTSQRQALAMGRRDDERLRLYGAAFGALEQFQSALATGRRDFISVDAKFLFEVQEALANLSVRFPAHYKPLTNSEVDRLREKIHLAHSERAAPDPPN